LREGAGIDFPATADGVVSYSEWEKSSGYPVVIEYGCGLSTIYPHTKMNPVKVGQRLKREEVFGYEGSAGRSTGPQVHYEAWKDRKHMNPQHYFKGRS
jgi:murein DD-endopeptidase MepM/ murein hydrolase activator NlpD